MRVTLAATARARASSTRARHSRQTLKQNGAVGGTAAQLIRQRHHAWHKHGQDQYAAETGDINSRIWRAQNDKKGDNYQQQQMSALCPVQYNSSLRYSQTKLPVQI